MTPHRTAILLLLFKLVERIYTTALAVMKLFTCRNGDIETITAELCLPIEREIPAALSAGNPWWVCINRRTAAGMGFCVVSYVHTASRPTAAENLHVLSNLTQYNLG